MSCKDVYMQALNLWTLGPSLQSAIEQAEYGELDALHRMIVLRNGLLANLIALCRQHPRLDSRPAILAIVTFLADNDKLCCTLTARRLGQLLCRAERNIRDSLIWLEEAGVLAIKRTDKGLPNTCWPRLPRVVLDSKASVAWFADAFSDAPRKAGRPPKTGNTPDADIQGIPENPGYVHQGVSGKYPGCRGTNTPDVEEHRELTKESTKAPEGVRAYTRVCTREEEISNPPSWTYNAALDASEKRAQQDVAWCSDGTIRVMNGFEALLARDFPRVSLTAGLAAVAGEQGPVRDRTTAKNLKLAILRRFGFMEQDEAGRDRRAAARRQERSEQPSWRTEQAARARAISEMIGEAARK